MNGTCVQGQGFETASTDNGIRFVVAPDASVPLVHVRLVVFSGSAADSDRGAGCSYLTWRWVRCGPEGVDEERANAYFDRLGARVSVNVSSSYASVNAVVLSRNLEGLMSVLGTMVERPALRDVDFEKLRREMVAQVRALADDDRALGTRAFRRALFGDHAYGDPVAGTAASLSGVTPDEARTCHSRALFTGNMIVGLAGDVTLGAAGTLLNRYLGRVPEGPRQPYPVGEPKGRTGRGVTLVDKPERSQSQVFVGTLGMRARDPDYHPVLVANTGFGGTFTSILMQEVREKRGWSYGTSSGLGSDERRDAWLMWSAPSTADTVDCVTLMLNLYDRWRARGLSEDQHAFARAYLLKSRPFDVDTCAKRLDLLMDEAVRREPLGAYLEFEQRIESVTRTRAQKAVAKHLSPTDLCVVVLGDGALRSPLEGIATGGAVERFSFDTFV